MQDFACRGLLFIIHVKVNQGIARRPSPSQNRHCNSQSVRPLDNNFLAPSRCGFCGQKSAFLRRCFPSVLSHVHFL